MANQPFDYSQFGNNGARLWAPGATGMPQGLLGTLATYMSPMLMGMTGQQFGGFNPAGNVYDIRRQLQQLDMLQNIQQGTIGHSVQNLTSMGLTAASQLANRQLSDAERQGLTNIITPAVHAGSVFAPGLIDQLTGGKSASVLGAQIGMAGFNRYNPMTGALGTSVGSTVNLTDAIYGKFYGDSPGLAGSSGLATGEMGQLFEYLQGKGKMGVGMDAITDSRAVIQSLQKPIKAVGALKEIFGGEGYPNAPIPMLMKSLEQLTQGATTSFSGANLEQMVRTMSNVGQMAGMSIMEMGQLANMGGAMAAQAGIGTAFGSTAATSAAAFKATYQATGGASKSAWGLRSANELMGDYHQRVISGASSPAGNRIGALMRLHEGGMLQGGAGTLAQKIATGQISDAELNRVSLMSDSEFIDMVSGGGGISRRQASSALYARGSNEQFLFESGMTERVVGSAQREEFSNIALRPAFGATARASLQELMGGGDWRAAGAGIGGAMASSLMGMDPETRRTLASRNAAMGSAAWDFIQASNDPQMQRLKTRLSSMDPAQRNRYLAGMADEAYGTAQEQGRARGWFDYMENPLTTLNTNISGVMDVAGREASAQAGQTGKFDTNPVRRIMHALQEGPDSLMDLILSGAGFLPSKGGAARGVMLRNIDRSGGRSDPAAEPNEGDGAANGLILNNATIHVTSDDTQITFTGATSAPAAAATPTAPEVM